MEKTKKIYRLLKDFAPLNAETNSCPTFVNILTRNYNPPAYIVEILLLDIRGFKNYGVLDKVLWHTYFEYKNYPFMVHDYKFGSWDIEGIRNDGEMVQLAEEIRNRIMRASKILDESLRNVLKIEVEKGKFYLNNMFRKLSSIFHFFEEKILCTVKEYDEFVAKKKKGKSISSLTHSLGVIQNYERTISNYSFALISAFFSLLEFLLDAIYAFEKPKNEFFEYRKKEWRDRFKLVFPVGQNKIIKSLYDEFIKIREEYRNPLSHGLTNEVNLLVHLPGSGLVPLSYEYLSKKPYYSIIEVEKDDALEIINIFQKFLKFMKNERPYRFYLLYLRSGLPVPVNVEEISKLRKKMTTYKEFGQYLDEKTEFQDMIINRNF